VDGADRCRQAVQGRIQKRGEDGSGSGSGGLGKRGLSR
jgi:hypothetical protein